MDYRFVSNDLSYQESNNGDDDFMVHGNGGDSPLLQTPDTSFTMHGVANPSASEWYSNDYGPAAGSRTSFYQGLIDSEQATSAIQQHTELEVYQIPPPPPNKSYFTLTQFNLIHSLGAFQMSA